MRIFSLRNPSCECGVVVIAPALHAGGHGFNPRHSYFFLLEIDEKHIGLLLGDDHREFFKNYVLCFSDKRDSLVLKFFTKTFE